MTTNKTDEPDANYDRDRKTAEADGFALAESTNDMPPPDLFHAAQELATKLSALPDGEAEARALNLSLSEPALWGMLDVRRAASVLRDKHPHLWSETSARYPWLKEAAEKGGSDAIEAMANQF